MNDTLTTLVRELRTIETEIAKTQNCRRETENKIKRLLVDAGEFSFLSIDWRKIKRMM